MTSPNPWIALDVSANPATRARELRLARDAFLQDAGSSMPIRAPILESWRRSAAAGLDAMRSTAPIELAEDDAVESLAEHPLGPLVPIVRRALAELSTESEHVMAITDADGLLLLVDGDPRARAEAAERMHFVAGARFSERAAGTNAIGTALAAEHAVQVFASEHFCDHSQWWTCVAAPIRDPASGELLGTVNLTSRMETVHPHSLALVSASALAAEATLAARSSLPAGAPPWRRAFAALGRDRAAVVAGEREVELSLRHSEILALLAARPDGLTADQLALALYGDLGKPVTARVELSRLRRVLPDWVDTEPYRLVAPVESDFGVVQELLRQGRASDAAGRYRGPLLPRSEAPGVVELQRELDGWVRRSVLASDDFETLWAWLATSSGAEDLPAWKRFLASVPFEDGRRGLAAARLERLRTIYAPAIAA
jgi:hypothetical protein